MMTPHLIVRGAAEAIDFYKRAFDATEVHDTRVVGEGGRVLHAEIHIGDAQVFISDDWGADGASAPSLLLATTVCLHLTVPNVDQDFDRAVKAGATVRMPLEDRFWGFRYGQLSDPFGHVWELATKVEDVSPGELLERRRQHLEGTVTSPCET